MIKKFFSRKKPPTEASAAAHTAGSPESTELAPKWHETLVLICEKCGKKLDSEKNLSLELKDAVKKKIIADGYWGKVRVSTSSCLDLCPEGKIAVAFTGDQAGKKTLTYAIDPERDREWLRQKIILRAL